MGESLFGGGKSKINSTSFTDNKTDSTSNIDLGTNQFGSQNQTQNQTTSDLGNSLSDKASYGTNDQSQTGSANPSGFQMPYLSRGLGLADQTLINKYRGTAPALAYTSLMPRQITALDAMSGYASGVGSQTMNQLMATGSGLFPALNDARYAAGDIYANSRADPTQGNISAASAYADNPYTEGMIASAQRPIERQLNEVSLPGLNSSASRTGNMDSSRAAQTEAILRRDAAAEEADVASDILGKQYNNALSLAEQARSTNLSAGLKAGDLLSGIGKSGADMTVAGNTGALTNYNVPVQVGQAFQTDANAANKVAYDNALASDQYPWQQLSNYWDIVGKPLGTETTGYLTGATSDTGRTNTTDTKSGTKTGTAAATSAATSTGFQDQTSNATTKGTTNTSGTQTQPGPGILGGTLGLLSGVGSFFAPGGAFGTIKSLF